MARSENSDPYLALNGPDPYLAMNGKREKPAPKAPLAGAAKAKAEATPSFEPSLMRAVITAIKGLTKKIDDTGSPAKPQIIHVEPTAVTVPEPKVVVNSDAPRKWKHKVTEYNEDGRIKTVISEVIE